MTTLMPIQDLQASLSLLNDFILSFYSLRRTNTISVTPQNPIYVYRIRHMSVKWKNYGVSFIGKSIIQPQFLLEAIICLTNNPCTGLNSTRSYRFFSYPTPRRSYDSHTFNSSWFYKSIQHDQTSRGESANQTLWISSDKVYSFQYKWR